MEKANCRICTDKSLAVKKLTDDEVDIIGNNCVNVRFKTGDIIIKQDSLSTNVAYIKTGLVKIHIKGPIKEMIMNIIKAPTYLCLPSSFGDKTYHFSATAIDNNTSVCFIDRETFKEFVHTNGSFAYEILMELSKGQLQSIHNCVNNAQKNTIGKIAEILLYFSTDIYSSTTYTLPISRQDLADMACITRESVSRILTDFHNEGILLIDGKVITILDEKRLEQISERG